jgi:hypothetical protein
MCFIEGLLCLQFAEAAVGQNIAKSNKGLGLLRWLSEAVACDRRTKGEVETRRITCEILQVLRSNHVRNLEFGHLRLQWWPKRSAATLARACAKQVAMWRTEVSGQRGLQCASR